MKIIANSLPKSGTHVLTRILDLAGFSENKLHFSGSLTRNRNKNIVKKMNNFLQTTFDEKKGYCIDLDEDRYLKERYLNKYLKQFDENTYSQGHMPYSKKLEKFFEEKEIKIIYIIREPRDVLVSHFHHHDRDKNYDGHYLMKNQTSTKEKLLLSLKGFNLNTNNPTLSLKDRVNRSKGWYFSKSLNICSVKFEDIIGEKGSSSEKKQIETLEKIENFLGLEKNTLVGQRDKVFYKKSETFRKGKVNDWINYFDDDIKAFVKKDISDLLIELGYENDDQW